MLIRTFYVCQQCGYRGPKCLGRYPDCGQRNNLTEVLRSIANVQQALEGIFD